MICVISANFNKFDKESLWEEQGPQVIGYRLNDETMPLRLNALTPRIQSKLVKCFGWQLFPGYDHYIWIDASFSMLAGSVDWLMQALGEADIAVFRHPFNKTIKDEYEFLKNNKEKKYIKNRYSNEFLEEQYKVITDSGFEDTELFCGGILTYRNTPEVQNMFKEWWYHTSRFHMDDQLSFPYVLKNAGLKINVIENDIYNQELMPYLRKS